MLLWCLSVSRTCSSGRARSTQTAACCWGRSARCERCWLAATSSWRRTSAGGRRRRDPAGGQSRHAGHRQVEAIEARADDVNVSSLCARQTAAQTRPLADVARTAAGGASRAEKASRAVRLRGWCRPLLATQSNAASGAQAAVPKTSKIITV